MTVAAGRAPGTAHRTDDGVAVITLAHGRHEHLRGQLDGLGRGTTTPGTYVVAAMADPGIAPLVAANPPAGARVIVVDVAGSPAALPLAAARNRAAAAAIDAGAEVLVFLDVDCIPAPDLIAVYAEACRATADSTMPELFSGPVHYLPPAASSDGYTTAELMASSPHPARPVVVDTDRAIADDIRLFWSLSFALTARSWKVVGGFDQGYSGYGGEDTDYALSAAAVGGRLWWTRGATAYHQHHDIDSPPVRHLEAIVSNSNRFHSRWGVFPMEGWLAAFEAQGLITRAGSPPRWHLR
ncbi:MAG: galactosyltransferase-related protein [Lapillicoccus sp.]